MKNKLGLKGLRCLGILFTVVALAIMPIATVSASDTAGVQIDATPTFIGIALNVSVFDFGLVAADTDENTTAGYFGVTDSSTITINTSIQCNSTWAGGAGWTWGAAGEDTGKIAASNGTGAYDVDIAATTTDYELNISASAGDDWVFELELDAPSSFTYGDAQQCQLLLTAVAT